MISRKLNNLDKILSGMDSVAIALSGGVDSSFLVHRASQIKGLKVLAITVRTPYMPSRETNEAREFCNNYNIPIEVLEIDFPDETIRNNPPERCYLCKRHLFSHLIEFARQKGYSHIADGSNADDTKSYRPGLRALSELSVRSPLAESELTKNDIRQASKKAGVPIWDKPAMACLLTRLPYNVNVTEKDLKMIDEAEYFLFEKGFYGTRVRKHGDIARIECMPGFIEKMVNSPERDFITDKLKKIGFRYVSLDLEGYRSGSMDI